MTTTAPKKSDLGVRTASAVVMAAVTGVALWLGGWAWLGFVLVVSLGVLFEWTRLFLAFTESFAGRLVWAVAGVVYIGVAGLMLVYLRRDGWDGALFPVLLVVATDTGAYFTGRTFGGPKIARSISPSKTWSGLAGGTLLAGLVALSPVFTVAKGIRVETGLMIQLFAFGAVAAVFAQGGDFFQSWMKRRAGVKDSSNLIPGHGGLFDRLDGLMAVLFATAVVFLVTHAMEGS